MLKKLMMLAIGAIMVVGIMTGCGSKKSDEDLQKDIINSAIDKADQVPVTGDTDESYEKGDFKYNSAGEIIGLTDEGNEKETITIPKGKNVISTLLTRKSKAKELNFEGSVDPDYDMSYMSDPHSNLEKVVYPEGIETVSREFAYCSKLKEVVLPGSVKEVEGSAFSNAESLEKINLEDTQIEIMRNGTFLDCEKMTEIHLPDTVKKILEYAIPRNVVDIYIADNTEGGWFTDDMIHDNEGTKIRIHMKQGSVSDQYYARTLSESTKFEVVHD